MGDQGTVRYLDAQVALSSLRDDAAGRPRAQEEHDEHRAPHPQNDDHRGDFIRWRRGGGGRLRDVLEWHALALLLTLEEGKSLQAKAEVVALLVRVRGGAARRRARLSSSAPLGSVRVTTRAQREAPRFVGQGSGPYLLGSLERPC